MTKNKQTIADRKDLSAFLRDIPLEVASYPILAVGEFTPGDEAFYASAFVVTLTSRPNHVDERRKFNVHTLVKVDDKGERSGWRLLAGTYETTFENAAGMAYLGRGLVQQHALKAKADAAVREAFKSGTGHAVYAQATEAVSTREQQS